MKQKNLWIAALALGITLSAHGQQSGGGISPTMLQQIKQSYQGTPTDKAIRNAITNNDINKLAVNGESKNNLDTYFSNKVESKGISNQRSSGRCWLFTGLNVFRAQAIAKYDMGDFQFSQNYSFFWDQLEKANLFLQGIIDTRLKPMDDKMVEEAKFMQKMIKEGLFDSEAFTQTDSVAKEKHVNGSVALTGAHYSHIQNALEYTLYEDHPEMRYVPMGPIYDANGNPYMPETYTTMGLSATAVFVVVHCRQIIVYQRVRVDHLHGCHEGLHDLSLAAEHLIGLFHQKGPESLTACQYTIVHRLQNSLLEPGLLRQISCKQFFNFFCLGTKLFFKTHPVCPPHS